MKTPILAHDLSGPATDQVLEHSLTASTKKPAVKAGRKTLPTRTAKKGRK